MDKREKVGDRKDHRRPPLIVVLGKEQRLLTTAERDRTKMRFDKSTESGKESKRRVV